MKLERLEIRDFPVFRLRLVGNRGQSWSEPNFLRMSSARAFARYALRGSGRMPEHRDRIAEESLEPRILLVRGQRVILDVDLARLYGVTTKRLNEGFKRNRKRFPDDFAFQLSAVEFAHLRSSSPAIAPANA